MTSPDPVAAVRESLAALTVRVTAHHGEHTRAENNLAQRLDDLTATVTDTLNAAAPRGPAPPRWDTLDTLNAAAALTVLRGWAGRILTPVYCKPNGCYEPLPSCWADHPQAVWELSVLNCLWDRAYAGTRPDMQAAAELHDRWLPGVMTRVAAVTAGCKIRCATQPAPRQ